MSLQDSDRNIRSGRVYLVGAGPGDPKLLTLRGAEVLARADVVVYDRLVHPAVLKYARPDAEMIYVGKASSRHTMKQEEINRLLVDLAKKGKTVVRLKGGDPFIFGRGGEEAEELAESGVGFEVVPGITSATAVPAYAGIPVTHRKLCSALGIITGHEDPEKGASSIHWSKISTGVDTLVFLMGVENLPNIVRELIQNGRPPETPVALIRWGTHPNQETLIGTLGDISAKAEEAGFTSPAVTVVGEVVRLRDKLRWFDNRPLFGKRAVVTRSREQASILVDRLTELGAEVIEFPVIKVAPIAGAGKLLAESLRNPPDWIIFTSANAVTLMLDQLLAQSMDIRAIGNARLAAIGPKTAQALGKIHLRADYVPSEFVAEAIVREFPDDLHDKRILIPRAREARDVLPEKLRESGAEVEVVPIYETLLETTDSSLVREMLDEGKVDIVTFTSSSTVRNFVEMVGKDGSLMLSDDVLVACIGPVTAETARQFGLKPQIVAEEYTIEGLVEALLAHTSHRTMENETS